MTSGTTGSKGHGTAILGTLVSIAALIVSIFSYQTSKDSAKSAENASKGAQDSAIIAQKSLELSQTIYDRSSGKIGAVIVLRGSSFALSLRNQEELENSEIGFTVGNLSNEPIDMLRTQIITSSVWAHGSEMSLLQPQLNELETFDRKLAVPLKPEGEIWLDLKKEIIQRLRKLRLRTPGTVNYSVFFDVECAGRLVGQESPSVASRISYRTIDGKSIGFSTGHSISISWKPSAFPIRFLDEFEKEYKPAKR